MKIIGVLGGMGPEATNQLCARITAYTPAKSDQEHLPVLCFNDPRMPDRTAAILNGGESPLPIMLRSARVLEQGGADFIIMPCNTAHYFYPAIAEAVAIPVVHMIEVTALAARALVPHAQRVGLLATSGTVAAKIYAQPLADAGLALLVPDEVDQEQRVMAAIYAIKAGEKEKPRQWLLEAAEALIARGADLIIAGCTEVPLALEPSHLPKPLLNPSDILAREAVKRALAD